MFPKLQAKLKSKKVIVGIIISLFILLSITFSLIQFFYNPLQSSYLEILCYSTQILSSLFVTGGVIIAVWQYYLSSKNTKTNLEIVQVQRAVDLSSYYKDNILRYLQPIKYIYENSGIFEIVNKIKLEELQHFDESEMSTLLSEDDIKTLNSLTSSPEFIVVFLKANSIYNLGLNPSLNPLNGDEENKNKISSTDIQAITAFAGKLFSDVLNNMEFFSMHFSHYTADETVVYQSLHQTYLQLVHLLYFKIARQNKASSGKYYTNVVWLYKEWYTRKQQKDKDFLDGVRSLTASGTIVSK